MSLNFNAFIEFLKSWDVLPQVSFSVMLIVAFVAFRAVTILAIRRWQAPSIEEKRRWIIQIKNLSIFVLFAGLFGVWSTELRNFALSMVAVAAAIAICTKDLILCFLGGVYKASARPFELGDRVEIGGYRGEVIDHNFLCTTLLEIGPTRDIQALSGRNVVLPNSILLASPVFNQSLQQEYVLQSIRVTVYPQENWRQLENTLLVAANQQCEAFLEPARHSMAKHSQREGLDLPRVEPRVTFQYSEDGRLHATLRFPTPLHNVSRTEQAILKSILAARPVAF